MPICLGHYASEVLSNPAYSKLYPTTKLAEAVDSQTLRMKRRKAFETVLAVVMPHPLRFKHMWHMTRQKKMLYAWKPIAPEGFIALGTIFTDNGKSASCCLLL